MLVAPWCAIFLQYVFLCVRVKYVSACAWMYVRTRESCSVEPLLAAASSTCRLVASSSLHWAGCHHTDKIRTEQCQRDSLHSVCWGLVENGRPSAADLMKALLNSHSTKPWGSAVQSPVIIRFHSLREIRGYESHGNVISSKPFNALLGRGL